MPWIQNSESSLAIRNLHTSFYTGFGEIEAVRGVDVRVHKGECVGIVGESGSGKSVTFLSILRLLASTGRVKAGEALYDGHDLIRSSQKEMRAIRGGKIAMIFQDPMSSLNPLLPIGDQVSEMIWAHNRALPKNEREKQVVELLRRVHIPEAETRLKSYPHEFSGGMRQRVMIAMALACKPDLLIADEPTTALDVSIQDQIINLLRQLQSESSMSIAFITHDIGVIAQLCTRVYVMYAGLVMEEAPSEELFDEPHHPYTQCLLACVPYLHADKSLRLKPIPGSPPDMSRPIQGCPFAPRCDDTRNICIAEQPPLVMMGDNRLCRCWLKQ